ncbi:NAD(P)-dependent oxidoreductase [uncultured Pontibacter sp.]|uniref:NAD-dependent epimerase/dehydratase family protein n=1 Tax=uncultured Pontibacter sp. TaxID=453356 RepID=UPI0026383517|nr:NAD(P)-dependent oxidoreductase [uncultured Pontibacter sp.]
MKILITGGAGFIGSAIIKGLQQQNNEIFVIDNLSFGKRSFVNIPDTHFYEEDILNRQEISLIFKTVQPDIVIHLAAIHFIPYCNKHPFESSQINIQGTANVLDAIADNNINVKKVFFASTAAVYPITDGLISETNPTGPLDIYGLSKLTGERLCNEFHLKTAVPTIICRFFNAFGPNETNPHLIPEIQKQLLNGTRTIALGNLTPKRDFIHTYDMARAVQMLLESDFNGIDTFNLGRGIEYSVTEIVEAFERQLGEKIVVQIDPARVRKVERMHLLADVSKLKSIGWVPEWDIDRGIKTLLDQEVNLNV